MPSAGPQIERYLEAVARQLASEPRQLVLVRGSAAVDPDSLAGSLAYAFLLHEEREGRPQGAGPALVVPFLPIPRQDLRLRPEVLALLEAAEIAPEDLIDVNRLELSALPGERLSVVLVDDDGRDLPPALRARVVEIVDHHPGATDQPAHLPAALREVVAPVGSACTLVAEQFQERLPSLLDRRVALLLLGPILLDTVDLDPAAGRVTDRDRRAAERLRAVAGSGAGGLYQKLREARTRLDGLSGADLLRRDFKASTAGGLRIGVSSVPLSAQDWISREKEAQACLRSFAVERRLDLLAVMFAFTQARESLKTGQAGGEFRRQLLISVGGASRYRALRGFLRELPMGLRGLAGSVGEPRGSGGWRVGLFDQGEVGFSRKRLEPELRRFCGGLEGKSHGG